MEKKKKGEKEMDDDEKVDEYAHEKLDFLKVHSIPLSFSHLLLSLSLIISVICVAVVPIILNTILPLSRYLINS